MSSGALKKNISACPYLPPPTHSEGGGVGLSSGVGVLMPDSDSSDDLKVQIDGDLSLYSIIVSTFQEQLFEC